MNEKTDDPDKVPEFFLEKDGITKKPEFSENLVRTDNKPEKKELFKKTTGFDMKFKVTIILIAVIGFSASAYVFSSEPFGGLTDSISISMIDKSQYIDNIDECLQKQMFEDAKKILVDRIVKVTEYEQFKKELDNGKMLDCGWCGKQDCEDKIKEETAADLRVIPSDNQQKSEVCVYCKEKSVTNALFARGY